MSDRSHEFGPKTLEAIRFVKSQLSAVIATGIYWVVVTLLIMEGLYYVHAVVAGAAAGAATDFAIKKWWVFGTDLRHSHYEAVRYALVSAGSAMLNGVCVYGLVDHLHFSKAQSVVLASIAVGVFWNYPLHRLFVFSRMDVPEEDA